MGKDLSDDLMELNDSVKNYLNTKVDLVKLTFLEKITRFTSFLISFQILILCVFVIVTFLAVAFAIWYGQEYDNLVDGMLIASGFLLFLALVFIPFRKKLITSNLLRNFSKILFEEDESKD